jgi:hypothetical protein
LAQGFSEKRLVAVTACNYCRGSLKFRWQRFEPDHVIETPVDGYVKRQNGQTRNNGVAGPSYPSTII